MNYCFRSYLTCWNDVTKLCNRFSLHYEGKQFLWIFFFWREHSPVSKNKIAFVKSFGRWILLFFVLLNSPSLLYARVISHMFGGQIVRWSVWIPSNKANWQGCIPLFITFNWWFDSSNALSCITMLTGRLARSQCKNTDGSVRTKGLYIDWRSNNNYLCYCCSVLHDSMIIIWEDFMEAGNNDHLSLRNCNSLSRNSALNLFLARL